MNRVLATIVATFVACSLHASVTGRIASADGKPLPGIDVAAVRPPLVSELMTGADAEVLAKGRSGADGTFVLDAAGVVDVRVRADGFAPFDAIATDGDALGTIKLRPAPRVSGKVTAAGKGVAGARVVVASEMSSIVATTDETGSYRVPDPATWATSIFVFHPDHAPALHPASSRDFALEAGRVIAGRVLQADGAPAAACLVEIEGMLRTTTAADGTFAFRHVPTRARSIRAVSRGSLAVSNIAGSDLTLRLEPAAAVAGAVVSEDGKKIPGVRLRIATNVFVDEARTGPDGTFRFGAVPKTDLFLIAHGGNAWEIDGEPVDASAGDVTIDMKALHRRAVLVIVADSKGAPLANVPLHYASIADKRVQDLMTTGSVTDGNGRAMVYTSSSMDFEFAIAAMPPALPPAVSGTVTADTKEIALTVPDGLPISGVVKDAEGAPIAGAEVLPLLGAPSRAILGSTPAGDVMSDVPPQYGWVVSDASGRFSGRLAAGPALLRVSGRGYHGIDRQLDVVAGMPAVEVKLVRAVTITGRVVDEDGKPQAEVMVMGGAASATTASDGTFTFDGLRNGPVAIMFGRERMQRMTVTAPARDVKLILETVRTVTGKVVDAETGRPVEVFAVEYRTVDQPDGYEEVTSPEGVFEMVMPRKAMLAVRASGYIPAEEIDIRQTPLVVKLERGRTIRGRVVDEQKQPLGGVAVTIDDGTWTGPAGDALQPMSAADGAFAISGVAAGADVRLSFEKEGFVTLKRKVQASQMDQPVTVAMTKGIVVTGRVTHPNGLAAEDLMVSASSPTHGASWSSATTDGSGLFRLDGLAAGRYDFEVRSRDDGERGALRDVDVTKTREIVIHLQKIEVGVITGRVAGADPALGPIMVQAWSIDDNDSAEALATTAGEFRLEGVPAGTVKVGATWRQGPTTRRSRQETVTVPAGGQAHVDLRFVAGFRVQGRVTHHGGSVGGVAVFLRGVVSFSGQVDNEGRFVIDGVESGDYDVSVEAGGYQLPFLEHVTIDGDRTLDVRLSDTSVAVRIVGEDGAPLKGSVEVRQPPPGQWSSAGGTDEAGNATIEVPGGVPLEVIGSARGYANATTEVTASAPGTPVTLRLKRAARAVVRVVDARDGNTLSAYVLARDRSGRLVASVTETSNDGTVELPLQEGDYLISASATDYGSRTIAAHAPAAQEIVVPLPRGGSIAISNPGARSGRARLLQPDGSEYIRCHCNGIAIVQLEGAVTLVDRVAPGTYMLEVQLADDVPRRMPVTVVEGETVTVRIE